MLDVIGDRCLRGDAGDPDGVGSGGELLVRVLRAVSANRRLRGRRKCVAPGKYDAMGTQGRPRGILNPDAFARRRECVSNREPERLQRAFLSVA